MWKTGFVKEYESLREKGKTIDEKLEDMEDSLSFSDMIRLIIRYNALDKEVEDFKHRYPEDAEGLDIIMGAYMKRIDKKRYDLLDRTTADLKEKLKATTNREYPMGKTYDYITFLKKVYPAVGFMGGNLKVLDFAEKTLDFLTTLESLRHFKYSTAQGQRNG